MMNKEERKLNTELSLLYIKKIKLLEALYSTNIELGILENEKEMKQKGEL